MGYFEEEIACNFEAFRRSLVREKNKCIGNYSYYFIYARESRPKFDLLVVNEGLGL